MVYSQVIVFNSHGIGQYAYTDELPRWGQTLSVKNWHIAEDGGKGSNVAVALGRLGAKTSFICKVGCDSWGDLGFKWLNEAGVDTTFLYKTKEISTGTGLILINKDGENLIIDGDSSSSKLTWEEVQKGIDGNSSANYFVTGYEVPLKLSMKALEYAKSKGIITVLNPSPLPDIEDLDFKNVDYLFINEHECNDLLKIKNLELINERENIINLKKSYNCKNIVVTNGDKDIYALINSEFIIEPSLKLKKDSVVNTAGAGDGFMAAYVYKMVSGSNDNEALRFAKYYSALSITIDGTIPSYRNLEEVQRFIKLNK